jgi:hypothetical protein
MNDVEQPHSAESPAVVPPWVSRKQARVRVLSPMTPITEDDTPVTLKRTRGDGAGEKMAKRCDNELPTQSVKRQKKTIPIKSIGDYAPV